MKPVYFSYLNGAGGKALINCLHTSGSVYLQTENRLQTILDTVPEKDHTQFWSGYEIHNAVNGCDSLDWSYTHSKQLEAVSSVDQYVPLVAHTDKNIKCYFEKVGAGPIIKIIPDLEFINLAISLKWDTLPSGERASLDLDLFNNWMQQPIQADIVLDNYNPLNDSFYDHLKQVVEFLDIEINTDSVEKYINKYRSYHIV